MLRSILSIAIGCFLLHPPCNGQNSDHTRILSEYFEKARDGTGGAVSAEILRNIPVPDMIKQVQPYLLDEKVLLRYKAIDIIKRRAEISEKPDDRHLLIPLLIEACKDKDGGNSGVASRALQLFNLEDFTSVAVDSINSLVKQRRFFYERIIRLAGFIQSSAIIENLKKLDSSDTLLSRKEIWAVDLALARSGDSKCLEQCMEKISGVPVDNKSLNYLFPDLVYMRQPVSLNYMLQEILSDEKKCRSSNPDKEEPVICAFRIIELVAPVIKEFPVKMNAFGEPEMDDYDDVLLDVRKWVKANKNYSIIRNIY